MIRFKHWIFGLLALLAVGVSVHSTPVSANTGAKYTVSPVIPDNQRTKVSSYFDLIVKPGSDQNLSVQITNQSSSNRQLRVSLMTAYTQTNGIIGYDSASHDDASMQYKLSDIGSSPQDITLPANKTKTVTLSVHVPEGGFKGVLLGSIYIVDKAKEKGASSGGVKLSNQFATVVAVQLQTASNAINQIKPNLKLIGVSAGIQDNKPGVLATVQNPTPTYWGKMRFNAKVFKRNSDTVVMKRTTVNYAVAPTSHFDFGILQSKALDPGDYTLDLLITGPHGRWHFKRNFSILTEQADKINKKLGLKRAFVMPWWGWLLIGFALAGLIWLIFFLIKRRKDKKDEEALDERTRTGRRSR